MPYLTTEIALIKTEKLEAEVLLASRRLLRSVEFNFGLISTTNFENVEYKGQFTQLCSRFRRTTTITTVELECMKTYLTNWINQFFQTVLRQNYYTELIETACVCAYYMYPFPPVMSIRMKLAMHMAAFIWLIDDILEPRLNSKEIITKETLTIELDSLLKIFRNDETQHMNLPEPCPLFSELRHYAICIKNLLRQNDHFVNLDTFCTMLEKFIKCANTPVDEDMDSEEGFCSWRKIVAFSDGYAEFLFSLENEMPLPLKIFNSTSFHRLLDLARGIGAFTNDLLGVKGELRNDRIDNWILYKVFQRKIPVKLAIEQVCESLNNYVTSYLALAEEILIEFSYAPDLIKYMDILEASIVEQIYLYQFAQRYLPNGQITLKNL